VNIAQEELRDFDFSPNIIRRINHERSNARDMWHVQEKKRNAYRGFFWGGEFKTATRKTKE